MVKNMKLSGEQRTAIARRVADASEKFTVGSWLIGVCQQNWTAMLFGVLFAAISIIINGEGKQMNAFWFATLIFALAMLAGGLYLTRGARADKKTPDEGHCK